MHPWLPASPTALSKLAMTEWAVAKERAGSGKNHAVGIRRPMINGLLIKKARLWGSQIGSRLGPSKDPVYGSQPLPPSEASTKRLPPFAMLWHP